jgi:DNA-binding NtrC family response regulator
LTKFAGRSNRDVPQFTDDALNALMRYDWPGNVRELNNALEHAATLCNGDIIDVGHLPSFVTAHGHRRAHGKNASSISSSSSLPFSAARTQLLEDFEKRYLDDLLGTTAGNLSEAARRSGIDRSNLRRMLRRHNIQPTTYKPRG